MLKTEMKSKILHWLAIVLILEIGLLHIITAQVEFEEAAYMGYLFAANFLGALIAAFGIYHRQFWGWMLGFVIAVGSAAGYAWSRTLGMPGMNVEDWFTPFGIVSMSMEGAFIILTLLRPWRISASDLMPITRSRFHYAPQVMGLSVIILISAITYQWNASVIQAFGHHVASLDQVCSTPLTTMAELEDKYGVQVSLVAVSMMGSIVDVRLKIIDPDKAHMLLQNQVALLVGQQSLILAPHMHSHHSAKLRAEKIFLMFFPTQQIIHPGSTVSLVFGAVRVEPVVVR